VNNRMQIKHNQTCSPPQTNNFDGAQIISSRNI
jgi:hypothetical protein